MRRPPGSRREGKVICHDADSAMHRALQAIRRFSGPERADAFDHARAHRGAARAERFGQEHADQARERPAHADGRRGAHRRDAARPRNEAHRLLSAGAHVSEPLDARHGRDRAFRGFLRRFPPRARRRDAAQSADRPKKDARHHEQGHARKGAAHSRHEPRRAPVSARRADRRRGPRRAGLHTEHDPLEL